MHLFREILNLLYRKTIITFFIVIGAVVSSFIVVAIILVFLNVNPLDAYIGMYKASFASPYQISVTLNKTLPRLLAALGIAYALRGGLWNIGAEGQIYIGAIACSLIALFVPSTFRPLNQFLALGIGFIAGGLWGVIPGLLKAYRGINEIITTLLSVYIAIALNSYLVQTVLKPLNATFAASAPVDMDWRLQMIWPRTILHSGIIIGVVLVIVIAFIMKHTTLGFSLKTIGENPNVAEYAGMSTRRIIVGSMFISGALAGLAGSIEVLGVRGRLIEGLSNGYGFEAIAVALLGAGNPYGAVAGAFLFGALDAGAAGLRTSVMLPASIVPITEGIAVIFVLTGLAIYRKHLKKVQVKEGRSSINKTESNTVSLT
jgi:simple sugar transport system permease protein